MDPYVVLGVAPGASEQERLARAYRKLAKRHHPDMAGGSEAARMAQINAAYELARVERRRGGRRSRGTGPSGPPSAASRRRRVAGAWLREPVRRALGRELLLALREGEPVELVTEAETWASPQTLLVVTDRRLLWLLDDVVTGRVRSLRFDAVAAVEARTRWRRTALDVRARNGRHVVFGGLRPETASFIARHVQTACARS